MKLLAGSFTTSMGHITERNDIASALLPPLAQAGDGLDLEFSLLLAFDSLIFDRYSVERLENYDHSQIRRITRSLRTLEDAGFVTLEDFGAKISASGSLIERAVDATTRDFSIWLPHIKHEFTVYDRILPHLRRSFGTILSDWDQHTFGIASYLHDKTGRVDSLDAQEIRRLIEGTQSKRRRSDENELIREVIKPVVRNVYSNLRLAEEYGCLPYGWNTLNGFYDQSLVLAVRNIDSTTSEMTQCRQFFELAFREFRPQTAAAWVRLLKDPRVAELRRRIKEAILGGHNIDQEFALRALTALRQSERRVQRYRTYSARIGQCVQLAAGAVGGIVGALAGPEMAVIGGIVGGGGTYLAQEGIDATVEKRLLRPHAWLYFTSLEGGRSK